MTKKLTVMFDVAGSVIVDELASETGFSSQLHPDGHLLTFFPQADGVLTTRSGKSEPVEGVTTVRHGKVYRTIQTVQEWA